MAVYDRESGFDRAIHNIESANFRPKFEDDASRMKGHLGIGSISDYEPQPLIIRSHLGTFAISTVGRINNSERMILEAVGNWMKVYGESVKGVSDGVVNTIRFFRELNTVAAMENAVGVQLASADDIKAFFTECYRNEPNEVVRAALLDDTLHLMRCVTLTEGSSASAVLTKRSIAKLAVTEGCNVIILAHNHPNGSKLPSPEDIVTTEKLYKRLQSFGVELADHVIVGKDGAISMWETGFFPDLE